jgi:hypothetical protein
MLSFCFFHFLQYIFNISNIFGVVSSFCIFRFCFYFESLVSFIFQIDSLATRETIITVLFFACFLVFIAS